MNHLVGGAGGGVEADAADPEAQGLALVHEHLVALPQPHPYLLQFTGIRCGRARGLKPPAVPYTEEYVNCL